MVSLKNPDHDHMSKIIIYFIIHLLTNFFSTLTPTIFNPKIASGDFASRLTLSNAKSPFEIVSIRHLLSKIILIK